MNTLIWLVTLACNNDVPYDLSQVPMKEVEDNADKTIKVVVNDGKKPELMMENSCVPPGQDSLPLFDRETVQMQLSIPKKAAGHQVCLDFIVPEIGELKYSLICQGTDLTFPVPKMLGKVAVAVFIDEAKDGPSADDPQGLSEIINITTESLQVDLVDLTGNPSKFYHFHTKKVEQPDLVQDIPPKRDAQ